MFKAIPQQELIHVLGWTDAMLALKQFALLNARDEHSNLHRRESMAQFLFRQA